MPLSEAAIGAIGAGVAAIGSSGLNAMSSGKMNKRTLAWNRQNFAMQNFVNLQNWKMQNERSDELWNRQNTYDTSLWNRQNTREDHVWNRQNAHNLDMWNLQNQYNSPAAQMERYKEAGLNPHLIYGQNNMGGTISTGSGGSGSASSHAPSQSSLQSAKHGPWNPVAPQYDFGSGVMAMAAFREQSARTNNLAKQNEVLDQEAALKASQRSKIVADTANSTFDLGLKKQLERISVDAAEESLRKTRISTDLALRADERAAVQHSTSILEAGRRIANMNADLLTKDQQYRLREFDFKLRDAGIHPDSPGWLKAGAFGLMQSGVTTGGIHDFMQQSRNTIHRDMRNMWFDFKNTMRHGQKDTEWKRQLRKNHGIY